MLALIGCLTEIGLRVYDSATGQVTRRDLYDRGMTCKSWSVHHGLKPSHTFAVLNRDTGQRIPVTINGLGLRGPEPALPKPHDTFRILCLGDELTLGAHVVEGETFSARLAQELPSLRGKKVEVINAGVPDYCPLLSYLQARHQLLGLAPDLVIFNLEMGDVADDYNFRRLAVMGSGGIPTSCAHPALEIPQSAKKRRKGESAESALLLPLWCRQRLSCLWANQSLGDQTRSIGAPTGRFLWLEDDAPDWSVHVQHALDPMTHLRQLFGSSGVPVVVAVAPAPWQVAAEASNGEKLRESVGVPAGALYRNRRPFDTVADFCRSKHIPCCDLSTPFQQAEQPEKLYLTTVPLFSPEGHALYARHLARFLEQELQGVLATERAFDSAADEFPSIPQARLPVR
jgi:hypothetical protein